MAVKTGAFARTIKWAFTSLALLPVLILLTCTPGTKNSEGVYARW